MSNIHHTDNLDCGYKFSYKMEDYTILHIYWDREAKDWFVICSFIGDGYFKLATFIMNKTEEVGLWELFYRKEARYTLGDILHNHFAYPVAGFGHERLG